MTFLEPTVRAFSPVWQKCNSTPINIMSTQAKKGRVWISQVYDKVDRFSRARKSDFKMFWKKAKFNGIVHAWRAHHHHHQRTRNFDYG